MTDYKKSTGSSGTMMIRDNGSTVSFMINANSSSTFSHQMPWGYTVNGSTNNDRESDYSQGDGWKTLGSWTVSSDQTVTFRLFDTGTSGLGGPTTLSVAINRSSYPDPPSITSLTPAATSVVVKTSDGSNNGDAIDLRQIIRNTSGTTTGGTTTTATGLSTTVSGLVTGKTYYFWARTHNSKGFSAWSPVKSTTTLNVPPAPSTPLVSDPTQTSVLASFNDNGGGGLTITGREIGYGKSTITGVEASVTYTGVMTIPNLEPGTVYYFWSRVRNSVGWSAYSVPVSLKTIAGARINVNGVWKDAVPYVNVGGTWKIARPWGRVAGVWEEST
jgi:hypothetical protein